MRVAERKVQPCAGGGVGQPAGIKEAEPVKRMTGKLQGGGEQTDLGFSCKIIHRKRTNGVKIKQT